MKIKERDAYLCNVKLLLILTVVFGHSLTSYRAMNEAADFLYRILYFFHMPLFAFLSGMGMKEETHCLQKAGHTVALYLIAQTAAILFTGKADTLLTPYWYLWYLLSLTAWYLLMAFFYRLMHIFHSFRYGKAAVLLFALAIGLICGMLGFIGRTLSLSRTLVFFPYVLFGSFWGSDILRYLKKSPMLFCLTGPAAVICFFLFSKIPTEFLYQAAGYRYFAISNFTGAACRFFCYISAFTFSACFLQLCPRRKFFFTQCGANTLWLYLFHPVILPVIAVLPHSGMQTILVCLLLSLFYIFLCYILTKWKSTIYVIKSHSFLSKQNSR